MSEQELASTRQVAGTHYRDILDYDADTGTFTYRVRVSSKAAPGKIAGWLDKEGYRCITIQGKKIKAHRLALWWTTGEWPPAGVYIDHINRNPADNRISNLRLASPTQSAMNRSAQSNNRCGHKGVFKTKGYWHARMQLNGVTIPLGYHKSMQDAVAAYNAAAKSAHGNFYYG